MCCIVGTPERRDTYTTAGRYCDLYRVTSWLTHLLQVQGLVGSFVVASFDAQRSRVDTHLKQIQKKQVMIFLTVSLIRKPLKYP